MRNKFHPSEKGGGYYTNRNTVKNGMEIQTKMTYVDEQKPSGMGEMQDKNERMRKDDAEKVRVGNKCLKNCTDSFVSNETKLREIRKFVTIHSEID